MATSPAQRAAALRREIEKHTYLYYVENAPIIGDQEFDLLMQELIDLEKTHPELATPDSPTNRVGGAVLDSFNAVEHAIPMMSIDNTYDEAEVRAFDQRVRKALDGQEPLYVLEPKVDGVAASLRYEAGIFTLAATRGDGRRGDDITNNARTIHNIPLRLKADKALPNILEVRGEIYMTNAEFARINQRREENAEELFANPRNAAAGTLKQLDSKAVAQRKLRFVAHGLGQVEPLGVQDYWSWIGLLKTLGLPVGEHVKRASTIDGVISIIEAFASTRATLAYQTDGMVVKVDAFAQRQTLGVRTKAPRWVIAFKYPPDQVSTKLLGVTWQVGKLGTLTPVAELEPVFVAGTTVRRATLHNIEQIERLDVRIGDTVIVEKAGEVIPQVVKADLDRRPSGARKIKQPAHCPSCGAQTQKDPDTPYVLCINPACPTQLKRHVRDFCARNQMNIERLGESLIDQLVDAGMVKTFADIYRLKKEDLLQLERMGEKSAQNAIDSIAAAKDRSLERLVAGLGIRHVGNRVALILAQHFGSIDAIAKASVEELLEVHEIGQAIAQSVYDFFNNAAGKDAVAQLKQVGIDPKQEPKARVDVSTLPLGEQSIVVTGTLKTYSRAEIEGIITKLGGRPSSSVSKKTSFVVAGEEAGSKLDKAKSLGVKVLSEEEFTKKISEK